MHKFSQYGRSGGSYPASKDEAGSLTQHQGKADDTTTKMRRYSAPGNSPIVSVWNIMLLEVIGVCLLKCLNCGASKNAISSGVVVGFLGLIMLGP